ncbi:MAG: pyridoxamine 5'-phosphate oxidase family protein [Rubripirellula sp.]
MGQVFERIDDKVLDFIQSQQMFFVATAPLSAEGRVNVSPKGLDSFAILDDKTVAYADLVGSGIETVAHLNENGRIVVMFCAFEGEPKIVRLHGVGEVITPNHADFETIKEHFPEYAALRAFIRVVCDRIADSCGWGVPLYEFQGQRSQYTDFTKKVGAEGIREYAVQNNRESIDGLPGIEFE